MRNCCGEVTRTPARQFQNSVDQWPQAVNCEEFEQKATKGRSFRLRCLRPAWPCRRRKPCRGAVQRGTRFALRTTRVRQRALTSIPRLRCLPTIANSVYGLELHRRWSVLRGYGTALSEGGYSKIKTDGALCAVAAGGDRGRNNSATASCKRYNSSRAMRLSPAPGRLLLRPLDDEVA